MKTMRMTLWAVLALSGMLLTGCSDDTGEIPPIKIEYTRVEQTEFAGQSNQFANTLLATLAAKPEAKNANIVVSPVSVQYLLSMMANTINEEAQAEIYAAMGMTGYSLDQVNQNSKQLLERLQQDDQYVQVALANSVWAADGVLPASDFKSKIKDSYNADLMDCDFANKSTEVKQLICQWAKEKTRGMVRELSVTPTPKTRILLANATYFNGKWSQPFNGRNTYKGTFYNEDNTTSQIDMMSATMPALAYADDDITAVELSYGRGYYTMMVVMPKDVSKLIEARTDWWALHNKLLKADELDVKLPKFKVKNQWEDMVSVCREMGINKLFDTFSGTGSAYVQMAQDVVIEVDENGTKAAAASGSSDVVMLPDPPKRVVFDHPFVYAIRENTTGTILFMGKVGKL